MDWAKIELIALPNKLQRLKVGIITEMVGEELNKYQVPLFKCTNPIYEPKLLITSKGFNFKY